MAGAFNIPKHKRRPTINVTSLIDVMFLLLIFFMVSSTFRQFLGIDVELPQAATATNQSTEVHEIVVDRNGNFFLDGEDVDVAGLERGLISVIDSGSEGTFLLRADANAGFGSVLRVIDIARKVGGNRLVIPTDLLAEASPD